LSYSRMVGSGRNRTSCPQGPRLQRGDGTSLPLWHFPLIGCGPRGCTGPSRLMRPRGFLTDLPAQMVRRLSTPSLAAGTSAVSRMMEWRMPDVSIATPFGAVPLRTGARGRSG